MGPEELTPELRELGLELAQVVARGLILLRCFMMRSARDDRAQKALHILLAWGDTEHSAWARGGGDAYHLIFDFLGKVARSEELCREGSCGHTLIFCTVVIVAAVKNSVDGRLWAVAICGGVAGAQQEGDCSCSSQRQSCTALCLLPVLPPSARAVLIPDTALCAQHSAHRVLRPGSPQVIP